MAVQRITFSTKQGWLDYRTDKKAIGGSDSASILGLNPYKSNTQLFDEKAGMAQPEDISDKPYVKFGVDAEPLMRALFALDYPEYEVKYYGDNIILNDKYPFAAASLDGELIEKATGRNGILEFKTSEIMKPEQWDKWDGRIPDTYYCQILHYFLVTEFDFAILSARLRYRKDGEVTASIRRYRIERSEVEADIEHLRKAEESFYKALMEGQRPAAILPTL